MFDLKMWKSTRIFLAKMVAKLSDEELLQIPEGFNNSMLWNLGHILTIQQVLHFKMCGLEPTMRADQMVFFGNGTHPRDWVGTPDIAYLREILVSSIEDVMTEVLEGKLRDFKAFTTSTGILIPDFESALSFNFFHEGLHTGYMMAQRKVVHSIF